jgi:UDP:flavonoid glycosyltransferase YjiC (YdhE family)
MPQHITILTSGTRGDVQPLIALAVGLQQAGYQVRFATHERFHPFVAAHGLPFVALAGDPNALLSDSDALVHTGSALRSLGATLRYLRRIQPVYAQLVRSAWEAAQHADALLITLPTFWGAELAAALGVPCIAAWLQPIGRTAAFPSPLQPFSGSLGATCNQLSHVVVQRAMQHAWRGAVRRWRRAERIGRQNKRASTDMLQLYGFSPRVVPRPADWPPGAHVTGYWFLDRSADWQPPAALLRFLADGPPPVYVGFGSLQTRSDHAFVMILKHALAQTGQRAILAGPPPANLPPSIFPLGDAPHDWLFPRMAAVMHHGGAGTTASALRAGVPQIVVPIGVDNFFWGRRMHELGVSPPPIPHRHLTAGRMVAALRSAFDPATCARAAALGEYISAERGVQQAVQFVQQFVPVAQSVR